MLMINQVITKPMATSTMALECIDFSRGEIRFP
jgi:hypothetical protein